MLAWDVRRNSFKNILYQYRLSKAQLSYFDHLSIRKDRFGLPRLSIQQGYQSKISSLYNSQKGNPCVIVCNGPSLKYVPLDFIRNAVSIGCNGIYKQFDEWGFYTDYLLFEDVEQFEIRANDLRYVVGPQKMAAIYNSYALSSASDWLFFNCPPPF